MPTAALFNILWPKMDPHGQKAKPQKVLGKLTYKEVKIFQNQLLWQLNLKSGIIFMK